MKIAFDVRETVGEKTGKGVYTQNLIQEMMELDKKNEYFFYTNKKSNFKGKNIIEQVIKKKGLAWHLAAYKQMKKDKIDFFIATTSYIIPSISNSKKLKIILVVHDLISFLFPYSHNKKSVFIEKITLRRAIKKSKKIVCVSRNTKHDLEGLFPQSKGKTVVIHNGVQKQKSFVKTKSVKKKNYILFVGTLHPRKNLLALIEAYALLDKSIQKRYKLVIVGAKGWRYKDIFKKIKDLGIKENIDFKGYIDDNNLPYLYKKSTVFVYPSVYEGFGLPVLESFQFGTPVIASNTSSLPEVSGDAAILVSPFDSHILSHTIEKVLKDEKIQKKMIEKGFAQVKKFSWEKAGKEMLKVLNTGSIHSP